MRPSHLLREWLRETATQSVSGCCHSGIRAWGRARSCGTDVCWKTKLSGPLVLILNKLNRFPQKKTKHFESIPIEQTLFPTLPAEPRSMDVYEIAVNFQDPLHQGDRRKKSQQCILINPLYRFFLQIQQVLRGSKPRRKPKVFLNYYPNFT